MADRPRGRKRQRAMALLLPRKRRAPLLHNSGSVGAVGVQQSNGVGELAVELLELGAGGVGSQSDVQQHGVGTGIADDVVWKDPRRGRCRMVGVGELVVVHAAIPFGS